MENFVMTILPTLSSDVVHKFVELMEKLGVESEEDLQFISEEELLGVLKPVQARRILLNAKKDDAASSSQRRESALPSSSCSAGSSYDANECSVNSSSIAWAYNFCFPWSEFPKQLMADLEKGKRPTEKERREMVRVLADHIWKVTRTPGRKSIEIISYLMVSKYPGSLEDVIEGHTVGSGYGFLIDQITNRIENMRRRISGFHPNTPPQKKTRELKRRQYGCENWERDAGEGKLVPDETLEEYRNKLIAEKKKVSRDEDIVKRLMKATYSAQRRDINENSPVLNISTRWPILFEEIWLLDHFKRLTGSSKYDLLKNLNEKTINIFSTLEAKGFINQSRTGLEMLAESREVGNSSPLILRGLELVAGYFKEDIDFIYRIVKDDLLVQDIVQALPPSPILIVRGPDLAKSSSFFVCLEKNVVAKPQSFFTGIAYTFACYFVFNMVYPKKALATLEFIQRYFAKINEYGSKSEKKTRHAVLPKVRQFLSQMNDHLCEEAGER